MRLPKLVSAVVLALGVSLGMSPGAAAQGGSVTVNKVCGPGVGGEASFAVYITVPGKVPQTASGVIACGASTTVPADLFPGGTVFTFHESTPPAGAIAAPDLTFTLTGADQTFTIVNNLAVSGGLSIHKNCPIGYTGTATFSVALTPPSIPLQPTTRQVSAPVTVSVPCGQTSAVVIPADVNWVGTTFVVHETTPPLGLSVASEDVTGTLSADASTATINDAVLAATAGSLKIHKVCASGVTGSATFGVTVTPIGATGQTVSTTVGCGATVSVAVPDAIDLVGATAGIHEITPPTNGVAGADVTTTLTADPKTVTVTNTAVPTGGLRIHKTCDSGVTGSAVFTLTVTPTEGTATNVSVTVPCGGTVTAAIPAAVNLLGAHVTIHESTVPTNGLAGADTTATLSSVAQTLTINNTAAPVVLPTTGGAARGSSGPLVPVVVFLFGVLLCSGGIRLYRRLN
jgi:hypothetical protein